MAISRRDLKILWGLSGNCCAFPGCSKELITTEPEVSVLAEMAHIIAQSPVGPRGASPLSPTERDSFKNILLLCPNHHKLIDKEGSSIWPPELLFEMKWNHEGRTAVQSRKGATYGPTFTTINYLNVPRILMDLAARGYLFSVDGLDLDGVHSLRGLGIEQLASIMQVFKEIISTWNTPKSTTNALDLASCENITEADTGIRIHFDQSMRTKNSRKFLSKTFLSRGNTQTDPYVYCSIGRRKACFFIDPRWVTTDTAFSVFMSGTTSRIAGLGVIKQVTNECIIATPLVIGTIHMINFADLADLTDREMTVS